MAAPSQPANGTPLDMDTTASTTVNDMTSTDSGLTSDEIALYDRQIRLWGAQAQERIRSAHILLILHNPTLEKDRRNILRNTNWSI